MNPECLILGPSTALWSARTILAIHGKGNNARDFARAWEPLLDEGWTLVVPQSTQEYRDGGFCWDEADTARDELRAHLDKAARQGVDLEELVIAGVSQGAQFALEMGRERSRPWLCVVPSFPRNFDISAWSAGVPLPPGGFIFGELDPARAGAQPVLRSLESVCVGVTVRIMKGVGHALPDDFAVHASSVLDEIKRAHEAFFSRRDS
ncbi:MAG TPA: hypothetical protein VMV03_08650 [Spirochaetia bacterium]|nr:hypothetical protein [Spirochaetia bacterium]